jgi:hypothetical protein
LYGKNVSREKARTVFMRVFPPHRVVRENHQPQKSPYKFAMHFTEHFSADRADLRRFHMPLSAMICEICGKQKAAP